MEFSVAAGLGSWRPVLNSGVCRFFSGGTLQPDIHDTHLATQTKRPVSGCFSFLEQPRSARHVAKVAVAEVEPLVNMSKYKPTREVPPGMEDWCSQARHEGGMVNDTQHTENEVGDFTAVATGLWATDR